VPADDYTDRAPGPANFSALSRVTGIRGAREILEGKHDAITENHFYMVGGIDEVVARTTLD
jgi:F0F1-type ATP synthase beta subunit